MTTYRAGKNANGATISDSKNGFGCWIKTDPAVDVTREFFATEETIKWLLRCGIIEEVPEPVTDADVVAWLRDAPGGWYQPGDGRPCEVEFKGIMTSEMVDFLRGEA